VYCQVKTGIVPGHPAIYSFVRVLLMSVSLTRAEQQHTRGSVRILLKESNNNVEKTLADTSQEFSQPTLHDIASLCNKDLSIYVKISDSPCIALSPATSDPHWLSGHSNFDSRDAPMSPRRIFASSSPPIHLDTLWNDPLYCFGASQSSTSVSKLDNTHCYFPELHDVAAAHITGLGTTPR
jgi:hypothetical protein